MHRRRNGKYNDQPKKQPTKVLFQHGTPLHAQQYSITCDIRLPLPKLVPRFVVIPMPKLVPTKPKDIAMHAMKRNTPNKIIIDAIRITCCDKTGIRVVEDA